MKNNFFNQVINRVFADGEPTAKATVHCTSSTGSLPTVDRRSNYTSSTRHRVACILFVMLFAIPQMWGAEELPNFTGSFSSYTSRSIVAVTPSGTTYVDKVYLSNNGSTSIIKTKADVNTAVKFGKGVAVFYLKKNSTVTFTFFQKSAGSTSVNVKGYDFIIDAKTSVDNVVPETYRVYELAQGTNKTSAVWLNENANSTKCADNTTSMYDLFSDKSKIGMTVSSNKIKSESKVYNLFSSVEGDYASKCFSANSKDGSVALSTNDDSQSLKMELAPGYYAFLMTTSNSVGLKTISFDAPPAPDAATPSFTTHPQSAQYNDGETITALTAAATVSDGGTVSYEWFKKGASEDASVGTEASYTPTAAGTYYCVATNKLAGHNDATANSNEATITIVMPKFDVVFMNGGAQVGETQSIDKNAFATAPADPEKEGYRFVGWSIDATEAGIKTVAEYPITVATTFTAMWKEKINVNYKPGTDGSGEIPSGMKIDGQDFTLTEKMFTRSGYLQIGWATADGGAKVYDLGGTYSQDASIDLYPAWCLELTYNPTFVYVENIGLSNLEAEGWYFTNVENPSDATKSANFVPYFTGKGISAPGNVGNDNIAIAKNTSAYAQYDLGEGTTVANLQVGLYGGSKDAFNETIEYIGADGNVVKKSVVSSLNAGNWALNTITITDDVPNVRYIRIYGASKWVAMNSFSATYASCATFYPVHFNSQGGSAVADQSVKEGGFAVVPAKPEWESHNFKGWSESENGEVVDITTIPITGEKTFYAIWEEVTITYRVTFDAQGGECATEYIDYTGGDPVVLPTATKDNHSLVGWYDAATDGTLVGKAGADLTPDKDTTLYAVWSLNKTIRQIVFSNGFDAFINNGDKVVKAYYMAGETVPTISSFNADNIADNGIEIDGNKLKITDTEGGVEYWDLTLEAVTPLTSFEAQTFNGSETYAKSGYAYATDKGWRFSKTDNDWSRETPGNTRLYFFFGPSEKATFTSATSGRNVKVYVNNTLLDSPTATAGSGSTFDIALNTDKNNMVAIVSNQGSGDGGVKAVILAPVYDVTYVSEKGGAPAATKAVRVTLNDITTVEGFEVESWSADVDVKVGDQTVTAGSPILNGTEVTLLANTTFTAKWIVRIIRHTVSFDTKGGSAVSPQQVVDGEYPVAVTAPTKEHFAFKGWSVTDGGTTAVDITTVQITEDKTFYAIWNEKFMVTFDSKGGTAIDSREIEKGEKVGEVADPEKWDNTFAGWNKQGSSEIIANIAEEVVSSAVTYEANWQEETGVIKLIDGEGNLNTTDFITGATMQSGTIEYKGVDLNFAKLGGNAATFDNIGSYINRAIMYNATTTKTKVKVVAKNTSTSTYKIYVWGVVEGATEATALGEYTMTKDDPFAETPYLEYDNASHRTIYITTNSSGNIAFLQVKVIAEGETLTKVGEPEYALNMNKGRIVAASGQSTALTFEGISFVQLNSSYKPLSNATLKLTSTTGYCSFSVEQDVQLSVTTNGTKKYYVTNVSDGTDNETTPTAGVANTFDLTPGTWYIRTASSAVELTNIAFAKPNAPKPEITAISEGTYCEGDAMPELTVTASAASGDLHYQWYKVADGGDVKVGEDANTYTPDADATYYVVVTNKKDGYNDAFEQSDNVEVKSVAGTSIESTSGARDKAGEQVTISVTATGKNCTYAWYACDEIGTISGDKLGELATLEVTVGENDTYYIIKVNGDCGTEQSEIVKVEVWSETTQTLVTESAVWNLNTTDMADAQVKPTKNVETLLANIYGIKNNDTFHADALLFSGEYLYREKQTPARPSCGNYFKFTTTVPGKVTVTFSDNGDNGRHIDINGQESEASSSVSDVKTFSAMVDAGEVMIKGENAGADAAAYVRFYKIEFTAAEVLRSNLTVGNMYTTCKADNMLKVWGAGMYEPESFDGIYVNFVEAQEVKAGYGYLLVAEAPTVYTVYGEEHKDAAVDGAPNGMQGTLEQITLPEGNNYCGVKNNHLQYFGANNTMSAEHAYIVIDKIGGTSAPVSARRLRVGPDRNMPTSLDNIEFNESDVAVKFIHNNQLYILREGKLFNAQGAKMR